MRSEDVITEHESNWYFNKLEKQHQCNDLGTGLIDMY